MNWFAWSTGAQIAWAIFLLTFVLLYVEHQIIDAINKLYFRLYRCPHGYNDSDKCPDCCH